MKTYSHIRQKTAVALVAAFAALITPINFARAQPLQPEVLFSFQAGPAEPKGGLVQGNDGGFYGTSTRGGSHDLGTVFRVTTNGALTTLASFAGTNGANPSAALAQANDGSFYGTTTHGGINWGGSDYTGHGTVFRVATNGELTTIALFTGTNGAYPAGNLALSSDGNLYGTTLGGGNFGFGTVFRVTANGELTTLVSFAGTNGGPEAGLTLGSDSNFYGTTIGNFTDDVGTVFRVTTNGVLTTLVSFAGTNGWDPINPGRLTLGNDGNFYGTIHGGVYGDGGGSVFRVTTNGLLTTLASLDYDNPNDLSLGPDGNFYGTTMAGGTGEGTVFRLTTNGVLTTLAWFSYTNAVGEFPAGCLALGSDGTLYGTTRVGGVTSHGAVFRVTTNGSLTTIAPFSDSEGRGPGGLAQGADGNFYGTTYEGGSGGSGTVFRVTRNGALTTIGSFGGTNGANPSIGATIGSQLTQGDDGSFYGTTREGGSPGFGNGTVFRITTNGNLTTLAIFDGTNGAYPEAGLTLGNDRNYYGTTSGGGYTDQHGLSVGTVFRVTTNGLLTQLASFYDTNGAFPGASLTLGSDGNFYGTTSGGGAYTNQFLDGLGTAFRVTTDGVLTALVSFTGTNGAHPRAGLTLGRDGNFYGTTSDGGIAFDPGYGGAGAGTIFRVTPDGMLSTLVSFAGTNGARPNDLMLGSDGNFYGTTYSGGSGSGGTVFQLTTNGILTTLAAFDYRGHPLTGLTIGSDGNFYGTTGGGGEAGVGMIYRLRSGVSIQSFGMTTNGFQLNALNVGGSGWVVLESSSDLATWTPIQTNGTAAAQTFLDRAALTQPRQYYRVKQQE